ncbi:hypothetical protein Hanom_Chr00s000003g01603491 [Helianthus anomalus]
MILRLNDTNLESSGYHINVLQVDLAGFVIWCGSLEFVGRNSECNQGYKMDFNFIDEDIMCVCI